jgi:hypothetical protein
MNEEMNIIESWADQNASIYAIVRHPDKVRQNYRVRQYEAMWMIDGELNSFGGSVGYGIADFDTMEEAQDFLLKGISECDTNPEIWLDMVEVK